MPLSFLKKKSIICFKKLLRLQFVFFFFFFSFNDFFFFYLYYYFLTFLSFFSQSLIRGYLDEMDPSFKMRVQGGSSCEYLWEVDFHPPNEPTRFVRELVHATLKDAKGYVEGLTEKQVNIFVDEYFQSMKDEEGGAPAWTPVQSLFLFFVFIFSFSLFFIYFSLPTFSSSFLQFTKLLPNYKHNFNPCPSKIPTSPKPN